MQCITPSSNLAFVIEANGDCHCFSYGSEVAAIIDGQYVEYQGEKFFSRTSCKHKAMFRVHFGIEK